MKNLLYILLFTISACSPDNDYALLEEQTSPVSPESLNLESVTPVERNTDNLLMVMLFDDPKVMIPAYDDYSWVQEFATEESFELVSNVKREGASAGRFQLNKNDPDIGYSKRIEMSQRKEIVQPEGWYGFSNFFPSSYVSDPIPEIIAQWHDLPDSGEITDRSNSNSIMTQNDNLIWQVRWDSRFLMPNNVPEGLLNIVIGKIPKNKWIDWVVHIKYSHTNTGILEVWMDGVKVIDRQNMPNGYNDVNYPFFKFGIYKWEWATTTSPTVTSQRVIYYDEVRVGNAKSSYDEVKPSGSQELVPLEPEPKINMMVNSYMVDCGGEMEGTCLLVQEGDMIGAENWENFYYYDSIEGFTYEPGFVYGLIVKKTEVENPPADGSSIRYELVRIVSKEVQ